MSSELSDAVVLHWGTDYKQRSIGHILLLLLRILMESNFLLFRGGEAKAQENGSKAQGHLVINGRLGLE